ncbi:hypothetical protein EHO59_01240 [Leptospira semungkisensis]|uniref:Uncharacterized protein n=1 Tax=Leptospira semungkisensis TaxID=2484985 RepID=A0A4R9G8K6_9LEPT|nr:hypothetical protein EHO59_01240 [Leptospira semungkisensis]
MFIRNWNLCVLVIFVIFGLDCFPDMTRKKKTENDWFKIEDVSFLSENKQLKMSLKGTIKNPSLESLEVYEIAEDSSEQFLWKKEKPLSLGAITLKEKIPSSGQSLDWIRKIGTSRKWILITLKNDNGLPTHLQTEVLIHESEKKKLRKEFSLEAEGEIIRLDGREWKVASEVNTNDQALLQYIPKQESVLYWNEMVTIHVYKVRSSSISQIYALLESGKKKDCPNLNWSKDFESENKIAYFWENSACLKQAPNSQVAKLFRGEYGVYNVRYDRRGKISDQEKAHWSEVLDKIPSK